MKSGINLKSFCGGRLRLLSGGIIAFILLGTAFLSGCGTANNDNNTGTVSLINNLPAGVVPVLGVTGMDLFSYEKIPFQADQIEVSSVFQPGMNQGQLIQPGVDGFWHVRVPKKGSQVDWVSIALDEPRPVALLRLLPRRELGSLMWRGYKALLQVSNDRQEWKTVASLGIVPWPPDDAWLNFLVLVPEAYGHYRLHIEDMDFVSIARLELYQLYGNGPVIPGVKLPRAPLRVSGTAGIDGTTGLSKLTIDAAAIQVSSALQQDLDGSALVQKGTDGFWHLKSPREEIPARVTFSLKSPAPVKVLRIFPRTGLTSQLWNGSTAFLEGSADGQNWQVLAALGLDRDKLTNDWISFALNLTASFSHYRLSVYDLKFLSLGRLELYTTADNPPGPAMSGNVTLKTE